MPDRKQQWEHCLQMIHDAVSDQQWTTWFMPVKYEKYDDTDNSLLVQVPSSYVYEYLEQHFVALLGQAITTSFGKGVRLKYRVLTDKAHNLTQDIEGPAADGRPAADNFPSQLKAHQTFDNFIEGRSNKLPRTVGLSIAEHPGKTTFNPFFLFGPSGCGKTHLVNAIGLRCRDIYPAKRILYVEARDFQVQYTDAVRRNTTNDFMHFYQSVDMLIVDDIQEWATATKTLDTFFHVFNHLFRNGKQIILASDRPPAQLEGMKDRLLTRFSCGLIAEMEQPNTKLCRDIMISKCKRDGLTIPDDVINYTAKTACGSVRDLEGIINSLMAYSVVYNCPIDMRLAERVIKRAVKTDNHPLTIDDIIERVSEHFNVKREDILGQSRKRDIATARQTAMYFAQEYTKMPATRIGRLIGGRDHSTVMHSCKTIAKRIKEEPQFAADMASIDTSLKVKKDKKTQL